MLTPSKKYLLVDGDVSFCKRLHQSFSDAGIQLSILHMAKSAIELCKKNVFDYVIIEERQRDKTGIELMDVLKQVLPDARYILTGNSPDMRLVVSAIKSGADNFLCKPFNAKDFLATVKHDEENVTPKEITDTREQQEGYWRTQSPEMLEIYEEIKLIASSNFNVIIYGQSGTGKEMIAHRIHKESKRCNQPFVAVDCGTLTPELAGSTLFGHIKGSFTGAHENKKGCFEVAEKGTLFLDEITNLSPEIQRFLLRTIQENKFRRIGDTREQSFDVRIIVASNIALNKAAMAGKFREDLFHRLNEFQINLPSLKERQDDILDIADYFIRQELRVLGKKELSMTAEVKELFLKYSWPGNMRELKNVIRRSCLLAQSSLIGIDCLPPEMYCLAAPAIYQVSEATVHDSVLANSNLKEVVKFKEKEEILNALALTKNNKTKAALLLNIDRKTLYNKMNLFGLFPERFGANDFRRRVVHNK